VSAATGAAFQEPTVTRRTEGNADVWEGLCGGCGDWVSLVSSKKKGTTWFRHAYKVGFPDYRQRTMNSDIPFSATPMRRLRMVPNADARPIPISTPALRVWPKLLRTRGQQLLRQIAVHSQRALVAQQHLCLPSVQHRVPQLLAQLRSQANSEIKTWPRPKWSHLKALMGSIPADP
jgi:hypothetical protein